MIPRTTQDRANRPATAFLAIFLMVCLVIPAPVTRANQNQTAMPADAPAPGTKVDKKFKGHLPITELTEEQAILHALNRLAYGPHPGDLDAIRRMGLETWIDRQLHPESIDDAALDLRIQQKYPTMAMSSTQLLEKFPPLNQAAKAAGETKEEYQKQMQERRREALNQVAPQAMSMEGVGAASNDGVNDANDNVGRAQDALAKMQGPGRIVAELSMAKLDRAVYSQRQLEAVMEDFWFNHFNVFAGKGADRWLLTSYVRDTIRPHTMGKFQDLLVATAKSPAMLFYLDNWQSVDPMAFAQHRDEIAMRQARYRAFMGGGFSSGGAQGAQNPAMQERGLNENYGREVMELHTVGVDAGYTQDDVIEMAKTLTGWTVREPRRDPEFIFRPEFHTQGKKVVMGHTFNYGGERDGEAALEMLANDRHAAQFISTEMAHHFVSDHPPQALVDRMAKEYESSDGDIRSVLKTMIYSPEFWSKQTYRAKVKTPFELVASTARALDADLAVSLPATVWVGRMGEPLFQCQPPTGYTDKAETWVNTGALLNRLNFALTFGANRLAGATVNLDSILGSGPGTDPAVDPEVALLRSIDAFLGGQIEPATRQTLEARLDDPQVLQARLDDPVKHVNEGLLSGLVLGTPDFQRR